jgi:DNA invertase Pin-like site-specific DNA recombinase
MGSVTARFEAEACRSSRWVGQVIEESTDRQDLELIHYIRDNNMGIIVDSYKDVASAWMPGAKRPRYKHALVDLAAGYIDGIACLAVDRLTRRRIKFGPS